MATLTVRPFAGENDLTPIVDLLNLCHAVDRLDDSYAVDDLRLEFADPRLDPARDLRLWHGEDGRLLGFGQIWLPPAGEALDGFLYWRVHPDARAAELALADEIVSWGADRLREASSERGQPAKLLSSADEGYDYAHDALARHGMEPTRYFYQMRRPLSEPIEAAGLPEGFALRHVASEADVAAWVEAYNQSFVDHWGFHTRTVESHAHWLKHPSYAPEHDLIAAADGTIAAFCFCAIDPAENERNARNDGWIVMLGTRRGYRKIGLGRAMLLAGLRTLNASGADTAKLSVDAANPTGALRLYESVGFRVAHSWTTYGKNIHS